MATPYRVGRTSEGKPVRIVIQMPREEVDAIDLWGVPAGMPSRNAAVRKLVRDALKVAANPAPTATGATA